MFNRKQSALLAALAVSGLYFNVAFAGIEGPPAEYVKFLKMKPMDVMHMMDVGKKGQRRSRHAASCSIRTRRVSSPACSRVTRTARAGSQG